MKLFNTIGIVFLLVISSSGQELFKPNAELSFYCSVRQGFNFEKDGQDVVGFINYLKIGDDDELAADFAVTNPEDHNGDNIGVVAVLSSIYWEGGYADPIQFSGQVSANNKNILSMLVHQTLSNTSVKFQFTVYDYDPDEKKYYKCFHCNDVVLDALIFKSGGELAFSIDTDQSMEVMSPKNFAMTMGVMPDDKAHDIHVAVSVSDKFVKQWGVPIVGGGVKVEENTVSLPIDVNLDQNYPNPFNPITTINFAIPEMKRVKLEVFDLIGNLVDELIHQELNAGYYSISWNASKFSSGVYYYQLTTNEETRTRKMLLLK